MAALALGLAADPAVAAEVHGETDVFSTSGISLAWAVLRGPDEARTFIVVRIKARPGIEKVAVAGRDPFTNATRELQQAALTKGRAEVRIPRASFADLPRTDWRFGGTAKDLPLTVFYLGVPDTTPEFADEARLGKYLEERLAK
jgi:hypothetical protein